MDRQMDTPTDSRGEVAHDETRDLIASDKVEGTAVYDTSGRHIGDVQNFMVNKRSGQVAYAVVAFGGFLGIGEDHYPLPWDKLTYDTGMGGYVVDIDQDRLEGAPRYAPGDAPWRDPGYAGGLDMFWNRPYAV